MMAVTMNDREDARRRLQRSKNRALALLIVGLCVLFYLITIARMGAG
jgi:hypothetical protein